MQNLNKRQGTNLTTTKHQAPKEQTRLSYEQDT